MGPDNRLRLPLRQQLQALNGSDWWPVLQRWQDSAAGHSLLSGIDQRVESGAVVYPACVFRSLALTACADVKVVVLGQDPYHGPGQAEGLAFSVPSGLRCPPSLRNIYKELQRDLGLQAPATGSSLAPWARQGVLLLNTSLTVEDGQPGSHSRLGWQALTDAVMAALQQAPQPVVYMLWGAHAQSCGPQGVAPRAGPPSQLVLRSNHPSPLSALRGPEPFIGNGHFGQANRWLNSHGKAGIDWQLPITSAHAILTGSPEGCPSG